MPCAFKLKPDKGYKKIEWRRGLKMSIPLSSKIRFVFKEMSGHNYEQCAVCP